MTPDTCVIEGMNNSAAYLDPIDATCSTGNTLYWSMVSGGLAIAAETRVDKDTPIYSHYPVQFKLGGKLSEDMGVRIRRPSAFQGITQKEAKKGNIPEGDFKTKEGAIDENWIRWNQEAETYLCHQEDKRDTYFKGRGQKPIYVNHHKTTPKEQKEEGHILHYKLGGHIALEHLHEIET
eukprot:7309236-Heterocapsa_arctica.AAC.1